MVLEFPLPETFMRDDLAAFERYPIYSFVAGRAIRDAHDPSAAAQEFKDAIHDTWQ